MVCRRLVSTTSVLSTVLCVVVLALWIMSFRYAVGVHHEFSRQTGSDVTGTDWNLFAGPSSLSLLRSTYVHPDMMVEDLAPARHTDEKPYVVVRTSDLIDHADPVISDGIFDWRFHTVGVYRFTHGGSEFFVVEVPYFVLTILFAVVPAVAIRQRRQRRTALAEGRCVHCGYDLRVTTPACPECGTPAPR